MATLNPVQVATAAIKAGFGAAQNGLGTDQTVATAVALAGSGGNTSHTGGMWLLPGAPPDADGQAVQAFTAFKASGWTAFTAHKNNSYLLLLPIAAAAVASALAIATAKDPIGAAKAATDITVGAVKDAASNLPGAGIVDVAKAAVAILYKAAAWMGEASNWVRVASVVAGGSMIIVGMSIIGKTAYGTVVGDIAGSAARPIIDKVAPGLGKVAGKISSGPEGGGHE